MARINSKKASKSTKLVTPTDQLKELRDQLILDPNNASLLYEIGQLFLNVNNVGAAISYLCQAVAAEAGKPRFYSALGFALYRGSRHVEAICAFRQALALDNCMADAYNKLGLAQRAVGDFDLAAASIKCATKLSPNIEEYWANLASTLNDKRDYIGAYNAAKKAHSINRKAIVSWAAVSESLFGQRKFQAALRWLRAKTKINPDWADGHHNIGRGLNAQGHFKSAQKYYRRCIEMMPDHADAHFGLSNALLGDGKFSEGWKEYEWRFKLHNHLISTVGRFVQELSEPMWSGEDLNGKTLLVYTEQGIGDSIQAIRFIPHLANKGARIILMVYPELVELFKTLSNIALVIAYNELIPRYDYHIAMFSLPKMLNITIDKLDNTCPYIPIPILKKKLPKHLKRSGKYRVGFIWATNPLHVFDHRSLTLSDVEVLFKNSELEFYSLQFNDVTGELKNYMQLYSNIFDLRPFIKNWFDTACLVAELDLIISIDSGLAHLAGALGIHTWVLLPKDGEWRWLSGTRNSPWFDRTPWYPSMRLFRSASYTSWKTLIAKVNHELLKIASAKDGMNKL